MSKPLFFTGRIEIARSDVSIRLLENEGQPTRFEASLQLSEYLLPPDAAVVVEAYHNSYLERFALGLVKEVAAKHAQVLKGLEPGDKPHFRVKIVGAESATHGKLFASVDEVRPITDDDIGAASSILPVVPKSEEEMRGELWRIHFVVSGSFVPELWVNKAANGLLAGLQGQDARLTALILPQAFRQILERLVDEQPDWTTEGEAGKWYSIAKALHEEFEEDEDLDPDQIRHKRREWVQEVVFRFATVNHCAPKYNEAMEDK